MVVAIGPVRVMEVGVVVKQSVSKVCTLYNKKIFCTTFLYLKFMQ